MEISLKIPFYTNLKDNNHCFQACLKMILKYYFPERNYSFKELDKFSRHSKGKWTWQGSSLLMLSKMGFEVINIENLDYKKFARNGNKYLKTIWSKEVFNIQDQFSNLNKEQKISKRIVKEREIKLINKEASLQDIEKYFDEKFIVAVSVNPCVFVKKECYSSHLVLITGIHKNTITFHDPGLPAKENYRVNKILFKKAMTKPWKEDTNLIAVRRK